VDASIHPAAVADPDISENEEIYNSRRRSGNDRETEDTTTARRQDESRPPVLGGEDESNSLPFIDEARSALKKNGFQGAKVIGTARGSVFWRQSKAFWLCFNTAINTEQWSAADGEDYQLVTASDNPGLPF